jgi:hypothetical protein
MVWDAKTFGLGSANHIRFLLLIIRGFSFSSISFEFSTILCSLVQIYLGNLLDKTKVV